MTRIGVRRRAAVELSIGAATALAFVLASCSGGTRPPPAEDSFLDAGPPPSTASDAPSVVGYDASKGILFGDNGLVNCGTQASAQTITLKNPSADIVNFTAALTVGGTNYKVTPASGGIPAHGTIDVQIQPTPIPAASDVAADLYAGTLAVKFATADTPVNIRLHETARGAIISTTVQSDLIDFGDERVNTTGQKPFSLTNAGNMDVTATLQVGTQQFQIGGAGSGSAALGAGQTVSETMSFAPTDLLLYTDTLSINFNPSAVLCKTQPDNVVLKGNGTSSVTVSTGTLNYGLVNCGGPAAAAQKLTIQSTIAMNFTATLGGGVNSNFLLANDADGTPVTGGAIALGANVNYVMRVTPKPVPIPSVVTANALGDTLTIHTDAPLDKDHIVALQETAQGAVFTLSPTQINVNGALGQTVGSTFSLLNNGNAPGAYTITVTDDPASPADTFTANLNNGTAAVGITGGTVSMKMPTTNLATYHGSLAVSAPGTVLCADLPPQMLLNATGAGISITTNPTALNFGFVNCGTTAPFQTIDITSIVTTTITPSLGAGASSPFTLADSTGTPLTLSAAIPLTANVKYTMRVVPRAIPIPSPTAALALYPAGLGDTLTLTSPVDLPKTIRLDQTAQGAIFAFSPTTLSASGTVTFLNSGNASGAYTITGSGGSSLPASGTLGATSPTNSTNLAITKTGAGTLTVSAPATVLCADPPSLTITN